MSHDHDTRCAHHRTSRLRYMIIWPDHGPDQIMIYSIDPLAAPICKILSNSKIQDSNKTPNQLNFESMRRGLDQLIFDPIQETRTVGSAQCETPGFQTIVHSTSPVQYSSYDSKSGGRARQGSRHINIRLQNSTTMRATSRPPLPHTATTSDRSCTSVWPRNRNNKEAQQMM